MQKLAQKRSILNRLREKTNIGGIAAEKFFNPEFERVMDSLRSADNKIRSVASGTDIEGETSGEDSVSLKDLLKSAKSNVNRREYMTALAFLGRFHKKVENIAKFIEQLKFDVDKVHHDFLFKDLDDDQKKYLQEMKGRFAAAQPALVAEGSILDFLSNIGTERGRALAAWEKRYPKQVKQIKKDITNIYGKSESLLAHILSSLKSMASARATRKIDDYMEGANRIVSHYNNYDRQFKDYYSGELRSFLSKQEILNPTKPVADSSELGKQEIAPEKAPSTIPVSNEDLETAPAPSNLTPEQVAESLKAPKVPNIIVPEEAPATIPAPPPEDVEEEETNVEKHPEIPPAAAHRRFFDSLTAFADESPQFLVAHISRYARSIQASDPETAIQLFNVVKSIKLG